MGDSERKFGVFILTHGRPANVMTVGTLAKSHYKGPWWLVCDDEDPTLTEYQQRFGDDRVLVFHKEDNPDFDIGDNGGSKGVIVYARNACDGFAQQLGLDYYIQLDDDYARLGHRWEHEGSLRDLATVDFDAVCDAFIGFLEASGALTVAFSQGGDHLGGAAGQMWREGVRRKAMNSFICKTGNPVPFAGRINEDVNTYTTLSHRGELMFTIADFYLRQLETQTNEGGMTDAYVTSGTYLKSFYSVMMCPSAVTVAAMSSPASPRIHHQVRWNNVAPKIVSERFRRG